MKITWHGHACMEIEEGGYRVVCDPFAPGSVPGVPQVKAQADAVYCSHGHGDHNYGAAVEIISSGAEAFQMTEIPCFHDDAGGTQRGENVIRVFDTPAGLRAVHLGDLGHIPDESQVAAMANPDVLMIPVGGFFTIDAATAAEVCRLVNPKVIIPMHFSGAGFGYEVLAPVESFLGLFPAEQLCKVSGNVVEVTKDTLPGVVVFDPVKA